MKSLEEINYYDGDASAVTADLSNNVDVKLINADSAFYLFPISAGLLPRTERVAVELAENHERRPRAEELHFARAGAGHDQVPGEHPAAVRVPTQMQI